MDQITANNTSVWFSKEKERKLPKCPKCGQSYMGDGQELCVECEAMHGVEDQNGPFNWPDELCK